LAKRFFSDWLGVLRHLLLEIGDDRVFFVAAGIAFYALLALFPALAALVALYGFFTDAATIYNHIGFLMSLLPAGAADLIGDHIHRLVAQGDNRLGLTFLSSFAISLWSANAGMKALFDGLNVVHERPEDRSFLVLNAQSLVFTLGTLVVALLSIAAVIGAPIVLAMVGYRASAGLIIGWMRWPALFLVTLVWVETLYVYGPSLPYRRWRLLSAGSVFAVLLWLAGSIGFSWYVAAFGTYNQVYGSLGAVVGFMTWIWLSALAVLLGAEINAELGRRREFNLPRRPSTR